MLLRPNSSLTDSLPLPLSLKIKLCTVSMSSKWCRAGGEVQITKLILNCMHHRVSERKTLTIPDFKLPTLWPKFNKGNNRAWFTYPGWDLQVYHCPSCVPGKNKKVKNNKTKQNKTKQNNQNGFYDINIEGTASPSPSLWQACLREQVVHLYFMSGVKCSAIARWFSGRPCRIPVQRITQDYRVHRVVRVPQGLEGLFPLPQKAWCGGCPAGVYCAGLTHACIAPSLLYLYHKIRFGCFVLFCFVLFCFVLFCFVLLFFHFLFFPGTQLGHYTCKSP